MEFSSLKDRGGTVAIRALLTVSLIVACSNASAAIAKFDIVLDQAQETTVTVANPFGFGSGTLFYNDVTEEISWLIVYGDLTGAPTMAHIHTGAVGVSGDPIIDLDEPIHISGGGTTGVYEGEGLLLPMLLFGDVLLFETALFSDGLYVNIHTSDNPAGEIRGQIVFNSIVIPLPPAVVLFLSGLGLLAIRQFRIGSKAA